MHRKTLPTRAAYDDERTVIDVLVSELRIADAFDIHRNTALRMELPTDDPRHIPVPMPIEILARAMEKHGLDDPWRVLAL